MRALVLEGGGMRAAYTNGVLAAFEEAAERGRMRAAHGAAGEEEGLRFDALYGASAGGALAAWYAAGQARYCLETWDYAADRRILSWRRFLTRRGPLLHHDALFDIVYLNERPLDVAAVQRAPGPVIVVVTDADTGRPQYVDLRTGPVIDWLRATGRLPVGTGPAVEIGGRRWLDGGLSDPVPVGRAIADGATEILVVLNRPPESREPEPALAEAIVARRYPALAGLTRRHNEIHAASLAPALAPPPGVKVGILRPSTDPGVGRLTRDLARIRRAIAIGRADGTRYLERVAAPQSV